jgi:hypothetical protein
MKAPMASARSIVVEDHSGRHPCAGLVCQPLLGKRTAPRRVRTIASTVASLQSLAARLGEVTSLAVVYPAVASSRRMALLRAARVSVDQAVVVVPQIAELCSTMAGRGSADSGDQRNSRGPICSIGFLNPSRLRGRSLSSAATQSRSSALCAEWSLLFGASVFVQRLAWSS